MPIRCLGSHKTNMHVEEALGSAPIGLTGL